jgi:hypothetical protein
VVAARCRGPGEVAGSSERTQLVVRGRDKRRGQGVGHGSGISAIIGTITQIFLERNVMSTSPSA